MDISTVKYTTDGYIVNDQFFVPDDETNLDCIAIEDWVTAGGTIDDEFSTAELLQQAQEVKKDEINNQRDVALVADLTITLADTSQVTVQVSKATFYSLQPLIEEGSTLDWVLEDNTTHSFVTADFVTFRDALIARNDEIYQARKRKDAVLALTTVAAVETYDITTIED